MEMVVRELGQQFSTGDALGPALCLPLGGNMKSEERGDKKLLCTELDTL